MTSNPQKFSCPCVRGDQTERVPGAPMLPENTTPLSLACGQERFRICRVGGDRKTCARMAQMGVLPGSEIELLCPGMESQCLVRVKGSTVTLDHLCAEQILVSPL